MKKGLCLGICLGLLGGMLAGCGQGAAEEPLPGTEETSSEKETEETADISM